MVRAGCIPLVHDSGGPVEIVGGHRELRFRSVEEGAAALHAVMEDDTLQQRLRGALGQQCERFSVEAFCESLRRVVRRQCTKTNLSHR